MNWQLFVSTFFLVFLAEMGDKTQLTVLYQTASSSSKWTVFAAGTLALVCATAIGVLAGSVIRKYTPDMRWIRCAGGILFLVFGALMLVEVFSARKANATELPEGNTGRTTSWIGRTVIQQTERFENAFCQDYVALANDSLVPREKEVYMQLLKEEQWHHEAMLCAMAGGSEKDIPFTQAMERDLPSPDSLFVPASGSQNAIQQAIHNEHAMAAFYRAMAPHLPGKRLQDTFRSLAVAEENHAKRLEELYKK